MSIVAEIVKKTQVGKVNAIVSAGESQTDNQAFQTVIDEARALQDSGDIELLEEMPARIRFKRLK